MLMESEKAKRYNLGMTVIEASQSGTLKELYNLLLSPFFAYPAGIVGGIFVTLATKFGEGRINEYYIEKERRKVRKIKAAEDINRFVIYGKHSDFKWKAESEKEVKIRAQEIKAINAEVGEKLRQFLINWSIYRNIIKGKTSEFIETVDARKYNKKAHSLGQELLEVAEEWLK